MPTPSARPVTAGPPTTRKRYASGICLAWRAGRIRVPAADGCASCHLDEHSGNSRDWPGGGACDGCHSQDAWYPAGFDVRRHNEESQFRLEGVHVAIPCLACHPDPESGARRQRTGSRHRPPQRPRLRGSESVCEKPAWTAMRRTMRTETSSRASRATHVTPTVRFRNRTVRSRPHALPARWCAPRRGVRGVSSA